MFICKISNRENFQPLPKFDAYKKLENPANGIDFSFNPECRILQFGTFQNIFLILFGRVKNIDQLCENIPSSSNLSPAQKLIFLQKKYGPELGSLLKGDFIITTVNALTNDINIIKSPLNGHSLFFYVKDKTVYLTDSIQLLKKSIPESLELNTDRITDLLSRRMQISNQSFYKKIHQINPGHIVQIKKCEEISSACYWKPVDSLQKKKVKEYASCLLEALDSSVESQLLPGDKVICDLSGGLDSSSVAACLAKKLDHLTCLSNYSSESLLYSIGEDPMMANEKQLIDFEKLYKNTTIIRFDESRDPCSFSEVTKFLFDNSSGPEYAACNMLWFYSFFKIAKKEGANKVLNGRFGDDAYSLKLGDPGWINFLKASSPDMAKKYLKLLKKRILKRTENDSCALPEFFKNNLKKISASDRYQSTLPSKRTRSLEKSNFSIGSCSGFDTAVLNAFNIEMVSPLGDIDLINYCLSIPESAFRKGPINRYLTRVATKNILPDSIRKNTVKGVQAPFWFVPLKKEAGYYLSLMKKFKSNTLISEFIDVDILEKWVRAFVITPNHLLNEATSIQWLPYTLHVCEWVSLHD